MFRKVYFVQGSKRDRLSRSQKSRMTDRKFKHYGGKGCKRVERAQPLRWSSEVTSKNVSESEKQSWQKRASLMARPGIPRVFHRSSA